nr:hypothetical protein [uncultured Pseudomonas sp.]
MTTIKAPRDIKGYVGNQLCHLKRGTEVIENSDGTYTIVSGTVMLNWMEGEPLQQSANLINVLFTPCSPKSTAERVNSHDARLINQGGRKLYGIRLTPAAAAALAELESRGETATAAINRLLTATD